MNNLIIAHRGIYNNMSIPENSLASFKKALKNNYAIELDIQMTKDNVLVVFHDDNLKRMTKINNKICNMTYAEINNLYLLNTKEKIPTLEEVLKLINNKVLLLIEIKIDNRYKDIIDKLIILLNNYKGNYLIQSFDYKVLLYLKRKDPSIKRGIIISNKKKKFLKYIKDIIHMKLSKPDFISLAKSLINTKYNTNKYDTLIWTIKNKKELDLYMGKYYGYICDNLPYKKESE